MIKAEIVVGYYDGPTEFLGKMTLPGHDYSRSVYGFWVYEDESVIENRLFSIWAVDQKGFKMEGVAVVREIEIDWSEVEY